MSYPTLSRQGFVSTPVEICEQVFADFVATNYSQSNLFYGQLLSLPQIIQSCGQDLSKLVVKTQESLQSLLSQYFSGVQVYVSQKSSDSTNENAAQRTLVVSATFQHNGITHDFAQELTQRPNNTYVRTTLT